MPLAIPACEGFRQVSPEIGHEDRAVDQAGVQFGADLGFAHRIGTYNDDLLLTALQH